MAPSLRCMGPWEREEKPEKGRDLSAQYPLGLLTLSWNLHSLYLVLTAAIGEGPSLCYT